MKRLVRIVFNVALIVFIISALLLLNITAPNPTHRRYSSRMPLTTGQGNGKAIGDSAEVILAEDLRLPNNNSADQRQCLCRSMSLANGKDCNLCLPVNDLQSAFRIPDFISSEFIAESKNTQNLLYTGREFEQISDYALAAKLLNRPLWVYIRVDTVVSPDFYEIVHSTGGNVIPYFTVPDYVDPVDDVARKSALVSGILLLGMVYLGQKAAPWEMRVPGIKMGAKTKSDDPLVETTRKVTHSEKFMSDAKARLRAEIDEEDEWNDL